LADSPENLYNLYQLYSNEEFSVVLEKIYWLVNFQERK
jgi:hypothetical protein